MTDTPKGTELWVGISNTASFVGFTHLENDCQDPDGEHEVDGNAVGGPCRGCRKIDTPPTGRGEGGEA